MYARLIRTYWCSFLFLFFTLIPCSVCFIIWGIMFWVRFAKFEEGLLQALFLTILILVMIPISIMALIPFFKDLPCIKNRKVLVIEGEVEEFEVVKSNGDPPTTTYYPIVKIDGKDERLKLCVDAELGNRYKFAYLPNTKMAIILEKL